MNLKKKLLKSLVVTAVSILFVIARVVGADKRLVSKQ